MFTPPKYGLFIREILRKVDQDIDLGPFDNDGPDGQPNSGDDDGWVDYLFVNMRSTPCGFLKGGATGIVGLGFSEPYVSQDARANGGAILVGGTRLQGTVSQEGTLAQTVGTMAHEFGHSLGLPDLYDLSYEDPITDSAGIGKWGLMGWGAHGWNGDDGPNPFCAWSLKLLGWISPDNNRLVEVAADTVGLVVQDVHQGGQVYSVPLRVRPKNGWTVTNEYLLLEQRTRSGTYYNRHLPVEGLLIWHVCPGASYNNKEEYKLLDLVCADGLYRDAGFPSGREIDAGHGFDNLDFWAHDRVYTEQHQGNLGDRTDPFDGVRHTRLTQHTNPSSDPQSLLPTACTGLEVEAHQQGEKMRVDVTPPHWAGTIREEVHWSGPVLVDGDVTVAPEGRLVTHPGTRVRFAGTDRLRRGRDPTRCELYIQGEWFVHPPSYTSPSGQAVFEAWRPGESWYGILLDLTTWIRSELPPASAYELRDAAFGLKVLTPENPALLVLGPSYTPRQRDFLLGVGKEALNDLGLSATVMVLTDSDKEIHFDHLFKLYLGEDKLVIWLGDTMDPSVQGAIRRFLERGGRLFLASFQLPSWYEMIPVAARNPSTQTEISSTGVLAGAELAFHAPHHPLDITAPAVPVLFDEDHRVSGLRLDTDTYRLVYLPFDLKEMDKGPARQLLEATLPLVLPQVASQAILETPDHPVEGHQAVIQGRPEQAIPFRVRVAETVEVAELVVHSLPGMEPVAEISMTRIDSRYFQTAFRLPASGQYLLWLRLRESDGRISYSTQSLQVTALFFSEEHPILVFVGERYLPSQREAVLADLRTALQPLGLEANVLDLGLIQGFPYRTLLEKYLVPGKVVIWLGHTLDETDQVAFREFLEQGGRLFMASFNFPKSPNCGSFLQYVLHIRRIEAIRQAYFPSVSTATYPNYSMRYRSLTLEERAEPVITDNRGNIAGLRLDNGIYRVVYLSFDLKNMEQATRQKLLKTELAFLRDASFQKAVLQVETILSPSLVGSIQPIVPRLIIANTGGQTSAPFQVGYQILRGDQLVFAVTHQEPPLEAHATREIQLPEWTPTQVENLQLRVGISQSSEDSLTYLSLRPLHLVEGSEPFTEISLPGKISAGNGAGFFDYDNDGDLDLYLVRLGAVNPLYRNDGVGFTEQSQEAGVADAGRGRGLALGDYDGDSDLDLYLVNEGANRLFRNEGNGRFADVTGTANGSQVGEVSLSHGGSGRSAGFFDYDNDGDLDLYLVNADSANGLFHNDGGMFVEQGASQGLSDPGNGRGLALGDYDGDGDVDVFVANQRGQSRLFRNEQGIFQEVHPHLEGGEGEVAAVFGDYDNDGDLDLFVSSQTGANHLYRNEGGTTFQRMTGQDNLDLGRQSVGVAFLDYDNDGDLDLAVTSHNPTAGGDELYQNRGHSVFIPVGPWLGLRSESDGRALSFGDYDEDGDLDLFVADYRHSHFYRNNTNLRHWLQVDLKGLTLNRHALGARIELVAEEQRQYREVQTSYGYGSQVSPQVHFGLGPIQQVDSLRIIWPDGKESFTTHIRVDQRLVVTHPQYTTAIEGDVFVVPDVLVLEQNYPNPFNHSTIIRFALLESEEVELSVFNLAGQQVATLVDGVQEAGTYTLRWDGRNDEGWKLASGVYLSRLRTGDGPQVATRKLLLLR